MTTPAVPSEGRCPWCGSALRKREDGRYSCSAENGPCVITNLILSDHHLALARRTQAEAVKEAVRPWREIVQDMYDIDECRLDHHGYCQTHGWFNADTVCPHKRARALRAKGGE